MVLCAIHLLNVVVFKLQVAFNINFIVVERRNVYVICHAQRSYIVVYVSLAGQGFYGQSLSVTYKPLAQRTSQL